jgi:glycosyltransferase involved in cell wall biosynthesis
MLVEKLVSVITPCFNGELYISRFLDSILEQTYSNIELILIDDGSTDNTKGIIEDYQQKFVDRGFSVVYIYQKNQGQAAAVNRGLKLFKGEYLTWPDSDDLLYKDSIKNKVEFLVNNPEYGFVRTDLSVVNEADVSIVLHKGSDVISFKNEIIFDDLVLENNVFFCPGSYMVTKKALIHVKPELNIYESRAGQNWQLLLPIALNYKCGYLDECLYRYVIRNDSHSHGVNGFDKEITRCKEHHELLLATILELNVEQSKYKQLLSEKYSKKKFNIACQYGQIGEAVLFYKTIKNKSTIEFIALTALKTHCYTHIRRGVSLIKSVIRKIRNYK